MKTKQLILLGPPGAKVKEHAVELAKQWHVPHVSMERLLNEAIAQQTDLGIEAQPYVETEKLVPDALMLKLVRRRLEQPDTVLNGWVLEGFPHTLTQAQGFDQWWSSMEESAATVVYFKVMTGILINRLSSEPGLNETLPKIRRRVEGYQTEVKPLLEYYRQQNRLKAINASVSFAEVARDLAFLGQENTDSAPLIEDEAELNTLIDSTSMLVVDCMASWCGSCKQVTPSIDKLAKKYGDRIKVMKIDFDANQHITQRFGLKGIPAVMFFKDGELLKTLIGVKSYAEYDAAVASLFEQL